MADLLAGKAASFEACAVRLRRAEEILRADPSEYGLDELLRAVEEEINQVNLLNMEGMTCQ